MSSHDQEPRHTQTDVLQSALEHIQQEEAFHELIHQLSHQGMDYAAQGSTDEARRIFAEALDLARGRSLPRWEAQILFNTGVIFDRSGKPVVAISYFERALALFQQHGPLRMEVNVSVFLGNMLWKTGEPERALPILHQALGQARLGHETNQIELVEFQHALFGLYRELGRTYQALNHFESALSTYQQALGEGLPGSFDEIYALQQDILDLSVASGRLEEAVAFGKQILQQADSTNYDHLPHLAQVAFTLGLVCLQMGNHVSSFSHTKAAYQYFQQSRPVRERSPFSETQDTAFLGRILVNLGSALSGQATQASRESNEALWLHSLGAALAFWRHGEELLKRAGADDVTIPRENLRQVSGMFPNEATFERLLTACETTYQELLKQFTADAFPETTLSHTGDTTGSHEGDQLDKNGMVAALSQWSVPPAQESGKMSAYERLKHDMKDIDLARDELIRRGIRALHQKQYAQAEQYLRQAVQADMLDESEACYYLAITRLWQRDFGEAAYLFEVDSQDREGEAPLSWLLAQWCALCASSSLVHYRASVRDEMEEREDPVSYRQKMFLYDYEDYEDLSLADLASAFFAYLRGEYQTCLELLDAFVPDLLSIPSWFVPFWQAMALASLLEYDEASMLLQEAQARDIPPLLLLPLRWFEQSQRAFYEQSVSLIFTRHDLWREITACNEREQQIQQERRRHLQWRRDHIDEEFPGFAPVLQELDAMRRRARSSVSTTNLECRYLTQSDGEDFAHVYAEIAEREQMGDGTALPVFLAEIPSPCAPRPATYLISALLEQIGDPHAHHRGSGAQKKARLIRLLKDRQVELVILTHIEDLTTPARTKLLLSEISWLGRLFTHEIGSIPLLLVGERSMIEDLCKANTDFGRMLCDLIPSLE